VQCGNDGGGSSPCEKPSYFSVRPLLKEATTHQTNPITTIANTITMMCQGFIAVSERYGVICDRQNRSNADRVAATRDSGH
jgi:hypothetical protein